MSLAEQAIFEAYVGAIDILKKEGKKIPKVFWALPGDSIPAALKEKTKGIDAYDSIFASQAEVGDFGGVELKEGDYNDCAVLCYSSGTVSLPWLNAATKSFTDPSPSSPVDWPRKRFVPACRCIWPERSCKISSPQVS